MSVQQVKLSVEERREKQRLLLFDTGALATLTLLAVVLSFTTYLLVHSFTQHRQMLEGRWRQRGEQALAAGKPFVALNDLRSALAYSPDDRDLQIELAMALAAAGRTQEAEVYFNTLLESEPGSGTINLQLARLAVRKGSPQDAVDSYQAAIDGTWNGDAFTQRRRIRLELARYLIAQQRYPEARNLLLILSGNAPDDARLQLELGGLLQEAQDPQDALDVYHKATQVKDTRLQALEGQAYAAMTLGRFAQVRSLLTKAVGEPGFAHQAGGTREAVRQALATATGVLDLYPDPGLPAAERARRIAHDAQIGQARLLQCPGAASAAQPVSAGVLPSPGAASLGDPGTLRSKLLGALGTNLQRLNPLRRPAAPQPTPAAPPALTPSPDGASTDPVAAVTSRWLAVPAGPALLRRLRADPDFAQGTFALALETERVAAAHCGAPTGEDAMLFRLAESVGQGVGQAEQLP